MSRQPHRPKDVPSSPPPQPPTLALSPDDSRIYTADGLDGTMTIIDLKTGNELAPIKLGGKPWGVVAVP